jgi:hypothetical protein
MDKTRLPNTLALAAVIVLVAALGTFTYLRSNAENPAAQPTPGSSSTPTASPSTPSGDLALDQPHSGQTIESPLTLTGQARGSWFFEGQFSVRLLDGVGTEISTGPVTAQGEWTTENFVPFVGALSFSTPQTDDGTLLLEKDNPSGLPENDRTITVPVKFKR